MADDLDLGAEPRPRLRFDRPRLDRRRVIPALAAVVVLGVGGGLAVTRPWQSPVPGRLAATGATCTVGYGSDLVVAAVEVANASPHASATLSTVALGTPAPSVQRSGGPIDIVSAEGCDHLLALGGDVVDPHDRVWLGLTVRVTTCAATSVPVVVAYDGHGGQREVTVPVPLPADTRPACQEVVGAARGG